MERNSFSRWMAVLCPRLMARADDRLKVGCRNSFSRWMAVLCPRLMARADDSLKVGCRNSFFPLEGSSVPAPYGAGITGKSPALESESCEIQDCVPVFQGDAMGCLAQIVAEVSSLRTTQLTWWGR